MIITADYRFVLLPIDFNETAHTFFFIYIYK